MRFIITTFAFLSVIASSNALAAFGCNSNICDPTNACYEGCPGNIPRPGEAKKYTLSGQCTVENADSKITAKFSVQNNEKSILRVNEQLKIDVINNIQKSLQDFDFAAAITISTIESNEIGNPPVLCPSRPIEEREACERRNEENRPYQGPAPLYTKFIVVPNKGSYHVLSESYVWAKDIQDTVSLILTKTKVHESFVSCSGVLKINN